MRILLQYKKKTTFFLFFSVDVFNAFEYLTAKKLLYLFYVNLCTFYPVGYNFVVILFEENRFGFNFEQMELFCIPH